MNASVADAFQRISRRCVLPSVPTPFSVLRRKKSFLDELSPFSVLNLFYGQSDAVTHADDECSGDSTTKHYKYQAK